MNLENKAQGYTDVRKPFLVISDPLTARIFFYTGIVDKLRQLPDADVQLMSSYQGFNIRDWSSTPPEVNCRALEDILCKKDRSFLENIHDTVDTLLDGQIGFFPASIRFNLRNNFQIERMKKGHGNWFYNLSKKGILPDWDIFFFFMKKWVFSTYRYVPAALSSFLQRNVSSLVLSNLQYSGNIPLILAAQKLKIPLIAYIASWDHPVGKGLVYPDCAAYIVQNEQMKQDLCHYHGLPAQKINVTGWPQSDVFAKPQTADRYFALLRSFGLDVNKPVVLFTGNTETNAPYEPNLLKRILAWWVESKMNKKFSLIFRPHPKSPHWKNLTDSFQGHSDFYIQQPSFTDIEDLSILLHHVACVVTNAGTILLDSLAQDRPVVCVLYDEGAPAGVTVAAHNVTGEHYKDLMISKAFIIANDFSAVAAGIEKSLFFPAEYREKRRAICKKLVGHVDGFAADRVVDVINKMIV